ncbi:MAG: hypothetical protein Q9170_003590, partial [Blastenia crenularia]
MPLNLDRSGFLGSPVNPAKTTTHPIAQNHARNAVNAPNSAAAGVEHEQAAGQFAAAANNTKHPEAFRTLKLLEQHHQKLADLVKSRSEHPPPSSLQTPEEKTTPSHVPLAAEQQPREGPPYRSQPQTIPLPQRDISSSIASNLASARGIPSNRQRRSQPSKPDALNVQRRSKLIEETYRNRDPSSQKPQVANSSSTPPVPPQSITTPPGPPNPPPKSDEPFQKFYSTFESLFSKLSAPLAFAGLPLNPEEPSNPQPSPTLLNKPPPTKDRPSIRKPPSSRRPLEASQRATADPDYSALFSRAALRAVADEHGPGSVGANESFYVVPTSGGTLQYADILARQHRERNRDIRNTNNNEGEEGGEEAGDDQFEADEELFVDARETPGPPSPEMNRKRGHGQQGNNRNSGSIQTMEELQLENQAMKALLDQTSRRLLDFEMSAQTSSVALQRSIRQLNALSGDAGGGGGNGDGGGNGGRDKELEDKLRAMEEQVLGRVKEMARVERENEKLKGVVG